ncbi:nad dependent epimerase [Colletotrichum karsti]|uniref:Nad dependent epimerase n=1 Tax=Colletotrichum karsti TaxID=1095194 RepID=A0A9P6I5E1_9PEZI|nr:nad dependent epimerase [Colletotrichum karsti]KAF9874311.1 nad dependent epimerase [Colletotrichum karsti]
MSGRGLVLITGLNGFIAGRTTEALLQAGHSVRGTVRSKASAQATVEALAQYGDRLEVIEVPDIAVAGAFDKAVEGVGGIIHLAQPVTFNFPDPGAVLELVRGATRGILESASKVSTIKSVVLLSSIVAVVSQKEGPYIFTEEDWNEGAIEAAAHLGEKAPGLLIYQASKTAGERAFWKFRDEKKPSFAMAAVNPVLVSGPPLTAPESADKIPGSLKYIWSIMSGGALSGPSGVVNFAWFVDVRDVAKLVAYIVDHADEADGQRYISSTAWGPSQAAADILRPAYPDLPIQEGRPGEGYLPGFKTPGERDIDGSKALRAVGQEFVPYDKSVLDTAEVFKTLLQK